MKYFEIKKEEFSFVAAESLEEAKEIVGDYDFLEISEKEYESRQKSHLSRVIKEAEDKAKDLEKKRKAVLKKLGLTKEELEAIL